MPTYIPLDEISSEIGVSYETLRKKCYQLSLDPKKITKKNKSDLITSLQTTINRKKEANEFISDVKNVKVSKTEEISKQSGSTLETRLNIAKKEFDNVSKSLAECQVAIDLKGTIIMNGNNGTVSSNPAVKTKCDLLKQQIALQKTIQELEDQLKLSISAPTDSVIDD